MSDTTAKMNPFSGDTTVKKSDTVFIPDEEDDKLFPVNNLPDDTLTPSQAKIKNFRQQKANQGPLPKSTKQKVPDYDDLLRAAKGSATPIPPLDKDDTKDAKDKKEEKEEKEDSEPGSLVPTLNSWFAGIKTPGGLLLLIIILILSIWMLLPTDDGYTRIQKLGFAISGRTRLVDTSVSLQQQQLSPENPPTGYGPSQDQVNNVTESAPSFYVDPNIDLFGNF